MKNELTQLQLDKQMVLYHEGTVRFVTGVIEKADPEGFNFKYTRLSEGTDIEASILLSVESELDEEDKDNVLEILRLEGLQFISFK